MSRFPSKLIFSSRKLKKYQIYFNKSSTIPIRKILKFVVKLFITYLYNTKDTSLPENCTFKIQDIFEFSNIDPFIINNNNDFSTIKYNPDDRVFYFSNTTQLYNKMKKVLNKYCKEGLLRSIIINHTQYYEPM